MMSTQHLFIIQEGVPWRSGRIKIVLGKMELRGFSYHCIILDDLEWFLRFKPSFMMFAPDLQQLNQVGASTNARIIVAKQAQSLEFTPIAKGECDISTNWVMGNQKEGRAFDIFFRLFEKGFTLSSFKGLDKTDFLKLPPNALIEISSPDYKHPNIFTGNVRAPSKQKNLRQDDIIKFSARIKRTK